MTKFVEEYRYGIYTINAVYNGEVVATYRISGSSIDEGAVDVLAGEIPLTVAIWIVNCGPTNHGWFEIRGGSLYQCETNRYTSQEMRWRIAKIRV